MNVIVVKNPLQEQDRRREGIRRNFYIMDIVKFTDGRLSIFSILLFIFIFILFYFLFSIFRTARVRTDLSQCHISHNLMA